MTLAPGAHLGPYEILAPLGAGGMGEVYKAKDPKLDRLVAIKVLPVHLAKDPETLARFEREAKSIAALNHPNILAVHDIGREGKTAYIVMELLEGESMQERLTQGPLPPRKATELAIQMAQGLAAAHDRGVIHRDLKPGNLWITKDGRLKILDFGLAKHALPGHADSESPTGTMDALQTGQGLVLGTLGYMSPEQVRGEAADIRSDIFAFGAVLYEMLSGKRAFARGTASDTLAAILRDDPPKLESTSRPIPLGLLRVVDHCLEKDPAHRFQEAHDLAFTLENALGSSSSSGIQPAPLAMAASLRRPWAAAAALLVLGAAAAWFLKPAPAPAYPTFTQISFRRGNVLHARFTPDGQSVVYSAAWDGKPSELFLARADGSGTRPLGYPKTDLQAVNAKGELLLILKPDLWSGTTAGWGTLALSSLEGGTPRELKEQVFTADFGPDGQSLAVCYQTPQGSTRLDYPLGNRLMESSTVGIGEVRVSPKGDLLAVGLYEDGETILAIFDRGGKRRDLYRSKEPLQGPVWSRDGRRLFTSETSRGNLAELDLDGHLRRIHSDTTLMVLHDQSPQGRLLIERELNSVHTHVRREGHDVDLSLGDGTTMVDLSRDGGWALLVDDPGNGGNPHAYLRRVDGSPAKPLGAGMPMSLSPDGKWALIRSIGKSGRMRLVPTRAGAERELSFEGWDLVGGEFSADATQVFVFAAQGNGAPRIVAFPLDDPKGRMLEASAQNFLGITADGKQLLARDDKGRGVLLPLSGGPPRTLAWSLEPDEFKVGWTPEGGLLVVHALDPAHVRVDRIDLDSGARASWQLVSAPDTVGIAGGFSMVVSRDGSTIGYTFSRVVESNLLVADGLK